MTAGLTHLHVMTHTMKRYLDVFGGNTKQQTTVHTLLHEWEKAFAKGSKE